MMRSFNLYCTDRKILTSLKEDYLTSTRKLPIKLAKTSVNWFYLIHGRTRFKIFDKLKENKFGDNMGWGE